MVLTLLTGTTLSIHFGSGRRAHLLSFQLPRFLGSHLVRFEGQGALGLVALFLFPLLLSLTPIASSVLAGFAFGPVVGLVLTFLFWTGVLWFSVLFHEMGHAEAARLLGGGPSIIGIHGLGGYAANPFLGPDTTPLQRFKIVMAGPLANLALATLTVCVALLMTGPWSTVLFGIAAANLILGGANLLPTMPHDGGQALREILIVVKDLDRDEAHEQAISVGYFTLAGLALLAIVFLDRWIVPIALLIWFAILNRAASQ